MSTWKIDSAHTDVTFAVKHMMVTTVRGRLGEVSGRVELDPTDVVGGRGAIEIDLRGMDSGMGKRDAHLRSADFFDVEAHPSATFEILAITPRNGPDHDVRGTLTIRGISRPVLLDARFLGEYRSMEGARRLGVSASTTIHRKDWDLGWNVPLESGGWLVGEDVSIEIDLAIEEIAAEVSEGDRVAA